MGIDFYACNKCGYVFADCGDFESCECGKHWCSLECAKEDGFVEEYCEEGYDISNNECETSCWRCEHEVGRSCNYCREEDFDDWILLDFALMELGIPREELIRKYKINNKS